MDMAEIDRGQRDIMREMGRIRVMKKGCVTHQRYPVLTWKERGRTKSMRLKTPAEVAWAENAVANYKRFTELRCAYERLAEQRALLERDEIGVARRVGGAGGPE